MKIEFCLTCFDLQFFQLRMDRQKCKKIGKNWSMEFLVPVASDHVPNLSLSPTMEAFFADPTPSFISFYSVTVKITVPTLTIS